METVCLGNGFTEEAKDVAECTEQPNCSTEDEQLEDTEGVERHPDVSNGDTEVGADEAGSAAAAAETSPPSVEPEAERTTEELTGSSDMGNSVPEASPDPGANGTEPANSEVSCEQVAHDTDVQQPVKEVPAEDVDATKTDAVKENE
uniref:Uncharacterized protein n=1 Tax=Arundo donax TaxID=35708 RepID=A0A0A9FLA6_ARUDO